MMNQYNFDDKNFRNLLSTMNDEDREIFAIDTNVIDWNTYMDNYCLGIRNYLLKQNPNSLVNCRKQMNRLIKLIF